MVQLVWVGDLSEARRTKGVPQPHVGEVRKVQVVLQQIAIMGLVVAAMKLRVPARLGPVAKAVTVVGVEAAGGTEEVAHIAAVHAADHRIQFRRPLTYFTNRALMSAMVKF